MSDTAPLYSATHRLESFLPSHAVKPLDCLLIFVPVAIALRLWPGASPTALFICSAIAIIPVAGWIGHATEALTARVGEGLGGLLNATFGNAAELIIAGIALSKGLAGVVKAFITGSIVGNILLVLGLSMFLGERNTARAALQPHRRP